MTPSKWGAWMLQDEGDSSVGVVLMAKDICAFKEAINQCVVLRKSAKLNQAVNEVIDLLEFASVTIRKNGTIRWKNGNFVN